MAERLVLFADWHNVYMGARRAFHRGSGRGSRGQVWPGWVGEVICQKERPAGERLLQQVRVYRGVPSPEEDSVGNSAARKQIAAWKRNPKVDVFPHTLTRVSNKCPECGEVEERLREKGVDVNLAIDLVHLAHKDAYDVGVVFSTDTDFVPAILLARELGVTVENALWWTGIRHRDRPLLPDTIWHHRLERSDYEHVRDPNSYVPPKSTSDG